MLPWEWEYPRQTLSNPLLFLSEVIIGREKPFLSFFPSCFLLSSAALRKKKRLAMAATSVVVDVCGGERGREGAAFLRSSIAEGPVAARVSSLAAAIRSVMDAVQPRKGFRHGCHARAGL